jgi:hypothetical protein
MFNLALLGKHKSEFKTGVVGKMKLNRIIVLSVLGSILLSGCSSAESNSNTSATDQSVLTDVWTPTSPKQITDSEFALAISSFEKSVDEFTGNIELTPNLDSIMSRDSNVRVALLPVVSKVPEESQPNLIVISYYAGTDWLFHPGWDLKSDLGTFSLNFEGSERDDKILESVVSEQGTRMLTETEAVSLCHVLSGSNLKFRLKSGPTSTISPIVRDWTEETKKAQVNACVIYFGALQGRELD